MISWLFFLYENMLSNYILKMPSYLELATNSQENWVVRETERQLTFHRMCNVPEWVFQTQAFKILKVL